MSSKKFVFDWIENNKSRIIDISDRIWDFAELGLTESQSSSLLSRELEQHGFTVERGVAGMPTAFVATWGNRRPVIGIMGEYDALPGLSQKRVPWNEPVEAGKPGHGCGHNIHGTSGMAAAIALKETLEAQGREATLKFFGCPAEENFSGKIYLVRDSYFSGVDVVLSHHPSIINAVSLASTVAVNSVKFHYYGKPSHAAAFPEHGRSALDAVELMNVGVNYLREHVIQDARIHYIIEQGGGQPNIVPPYARSWYYIRAPERSQTEFITDWILDIAKAAATMTRTELKIEFIVGMHNLIPNRTLGDVIVSNMRAIDKPTYDHEDEVFAREITKSVSLDTKRDVLKEFKHPNWETLAEKLMDDEVPDPWGEGTIVHGSTDVSDVSWQVPTMEFNTAAWAIGTMAHSWQSVAQSGVGLGHKSLIFASKVLAATVLDLIEDHTLINKAKEEHRQRIGSRIYTSPIPPEAKPPLDAWRK